MDRSIKPASDSVPFTPELGRLLIDGAWLSGEGVAWQRVSPANAEVMWEGNWASSSQVDRAVGAARQAFPTWSEKSLDERMSVCRKFAETLKARQEELASIVARETGKPLWEARTEVGAAATKVANSFDAILKRRWTTTEEMGDLLAVTRYRPHGVMLVLGPFNLPAHLPGAHIVPALLAGNTIVFKPSELAPATGQWLAEAWHSAGLPAGVLNLLHGAAEVATAAVEHVEVDGVLFTGSHRVGVKLHQMLAGKPHKILALELGGNNPLVVHGASDLRGAAITTIQSAYITSGQRCTCARRLIVVGESLSAQLSEQLRELIPKIAVGLPMEEPQPFMGTLINERAAEQMLNAQAVLLERGAEPVVPMQRRESCNALVTPGLLELKSGAQVDDCEHFGPLLTLQTAHDFEEAIALANQTQFGLSAGFVGDRVEDFHYFLHRIRAGVVNWNRQTTGASGKLPFGGVGGSGNHRPSGYFAADYCSYPMASLESHTLNETGQAVPGLERL